MLEFLKNHKRYRETIFLVGLSFTCLLISIFRCVYTDSLLFAFLIWNLFLAFLPWLFTSIYIIRNSERWKRIKVLFLLSSWLLFFPNAPYILTDLFHLRLDSNMPIWFDLVLILSFAWTGLFFGFLSLLDIENILLTKLKKRMVDIVTVLLLFISSFGIYVGRYLRWNSWDIISHPSNLFYDIFDRVINPTSHPRTWGMTFFMWILLCMLYYSFKFLRTREN